MATAPAPDLSPEVAAGILYLDETHPGWYSLIDWRSLDMGNPHFCLLGQLDLLERASTTFDLGSYAAYVYRHGKGTQWAEEHGFSLRWLSTNSYAVVARLFVALTEQWQTYIAWRRGYTSVPTVEAALLYV